MVEDLTGEVEAVLFPQAYARTSPENLQLGARVILSGKPTRLFEASQEPASQNIELLVDTVIPLENFIRESVVSWAIRLPGPSKTTGRVALGSSSPIETPRAGLFLAKAKLLSLSTQ